MSTVEDCLDMLGLFLMIHNTPQSLHSFVCNLSKGITFKLIPGGNFESWLIWFAPDILTYGYCNNGLELPLHVFTYKLIMYHFYKPVHTIQALYN